MQVRVATFNPNNLFSRFNFQAVVDDIPPSDGGGRTLTFGSDRIKARTFMGRLKPPSTPTHRGAASSAAICCRPRFSTPTATSFSGCTART